MKKRFIALMLAGMLAAQGAAPFYAEAEEILIEEEVISDDGEQITESDAAEEAEIFSDDLLALEDIVDIEDDAVEKDTSANVYGSLRDLGNIGDADDGFHSQMTGSLRKAPARAGSVQSSGDGAYYGSLLSGNAKEIYKQLVSQEAEWKPDADSSRVYDLTVDLSGSPYTYTPNYSEGLYYPDEDAAYTALTADVIDADVACALDAYLYDFPEKAFWFNSVSYWTGMSLSEDENGVTCYVYEVNLVAFERWTGAFDQQDSFSNDVTDSVSYIREVPNWSSLTIGEKLKRVHDYICRKVTYGDAYNVIETQHTPYGAYYDGVVVCEGYAKLFKVLLDRLGLAECIIVTGTSENPQGDTENHMWNMVQLDGAWYFADLTWDDYDSPYYNYFLAGSSSRGYDKTVGAEHTVQQRLTCPAASETMYHDKKPSGYTSTNCEVESVVTYTCHLHSRMAGAQEMAPYTETSAPRPHSWSQKYTVDKRSTCSEEGSESIHCSVCGAIQEGASRAIGTTTHTWDDGAVTTAPTVDAEGVRTFTCRVCSAQRTESIPKHEHSWDSGQITTQPTCVADGVKTYHCICGETRTETVAKDSNNHSGIVKDSAVSATVNDSGKTEGSHCSACGTVIVPQADVPKLDLSGNAADPTSMAAVEQSAASMADNGEMAGASFAQIQAYIKKATKNSLTIQWTKVPGAAGYKIYGNLCGSAYKYQFIAETGAGASSYKASGLLKGKSYKYFVVAYAMNADGTQKKLAVSKTMHAFTQGGKNCNVKSLSTKKTLKIKKGKTAKLKVTIKKEKSSLKFKAHRKMSYETSDARVATVDKKGKVKATGKGKCVIYAYSSTGVYAKIKVTVK